MDIFEAMSKRRSVRTFNRQPLPDADKSALLDAATYAANPFGGEVYIRIREFDLQNGYKPSTYGMIRGASDFFLVGFGTSEADELSAGFVFEQVVLKAWQMGYGTCWIAATFNGSQFDGGQTWPEDAKLRIVSPVGIAASQSAVERISRLCAGSNRRKAFGDLFFEHNFAGQLPADNTFAKALGMLRLAPSSTNSQPWRATVDGTTVNFYYKNCSRYSVLDCGIALSHFYLSELHSGQTGDFHKSMPDTTAPDGLKYLISYTRHQKMTTPALI